MSGRLEPDGDPSPNASRGSSSDGDERDPADGDRNPPERAIIGYHRDEAGDWVADLGCGHGQHVRHNPPWQMRPWVTTEEGRRSRLGMTLPCRRCLA